jgi:hypothetical protein
VAQMTGSKEQGGATHLGLSWWSLGLVIGNTGEDRLETYICFLGKFCDSDFLQVVCSFYYILSPNLYRLLIAHMSARFIHTHDSHRKLPGKLGCGPWEFANLQVS